MTKLSKTFKKSTTKIYSRLQVTTAAQKFFLLNDFEYDCFAIKAFFWPIQLGRDIKRFATWKMWRFSQFFYGLPKLEGWGLLKSD